MRVVLDISGLNPKAFDRGVGFYTKHLFSSLQEQCKNDSFLLKKNNLSVSADIIHYPYFDPFFLTLPLFTKIPTVVTVHDLTPILFPQNYPSGIKGKIKWQIQRFSLDIKQAIITDSQNSKKDINKLINFPKEKIHVIYLAADGEFKPKENIKEIKIRYRLPEKFLLYVGDLNWNKNISGLITAFRKIKSQLYQTDYKLIFVGKSFTVNNLKELKDLKLFINKLNLERDILYLGYLPTTDLVSVYNLATLYVQPSFYEGFGLPILEAMNCGCPVLSSNKGSLPEVGGNACEYFNPDKKEELSKKLFSLLQDSNRLLGLKEKGLKQAKLFSWQKTAFETLRVYKLIYEQTV